MEKDFKIMPAKTKGLPYDYGSIMHYGLYDFSKNGKETISILETTKKKVGQREHLSDDDIQWLYEFYYTGE